MSTTNAATPHDRADQRFTLDLRGHTVELTVYPSAPPVLPVTAAEVLLALDSLPRAEVSGLRVQAAVARPNGRPVPVAEISVPAGLREPWFLAISPDVLAAFAVPRTPVTKAEPPRPLSRQAAALAEIGVGEATDNEPPNCSADALRAALDRAGVTDGIDDAVLAEYETPHPLPGIICLARGLPPTPGQNGKITFAFSTEQHEGHDAQETGRVDYHAAVTHRFVEAGDLLATRTPAVPGAPGRTILGQAIMPPVAHDPDLPSLAGKNTEIDGERLLRRAQDNRW